MKKKDWKKTVEAHAAQRRLAIFTRLQTQTMILREALRAVALSKDHAEAVMFASNALDWRILPDEEAP